MLLFSRNMLTTLVHPLQTPSKPPPHDFVASLAVRGNLRSVPDLINAAPRQLSDALGVPPYRFVAWIFLPRSPPAIDDLLRFQVRCIRHLAIAHAGDCLFPCECYAVLWAELFFAPDPLIFSAGCASRVDYAPTARSNRQYLRIVWQRRSLSY